MFQALKLVIILIIIGMIAAGGWYITGMRANLLMSEENNKRLMEAVDEQNKLMEQQRKDIEAIKTVNEELQNQNKKLEKDKDALSTKFNKRDFGKFAAENPSAVETLVNRGTANVMRCFELASGAPLNEKELKANSPTEGNRECPSLINPAYNSPN